MTNSYQAVQWNHHKRLYDLCIVAFVVFFVTGFVVLGRVFFPPPGDISLPVLLIRALGICAVLMLHIILIIGPLARISPRFSPLLYNRRHLGVSFFIVALMHAVLVIGFYGGFGTRNPITAVLLHESDTVPFELLGFLALVIFATSGSPISGPRSGSSCTWASMSRTRSSSPMSYSARSKARTTASRSCSSVLVP